jgi:hypothetical protein
MRTIEHTSQFKKDYKREAKGQHRATLAQDFLFTVNALATISCWRSAIMTTLSPASGRTTATATSSPTWCSSIASRMREDCSLSVSARTQN